MFKLAINVLKYICFKNKLYIQFFNIIPDGFLFLRLYHFYIASQGFFASLFIFFQATKHFFIFFL